MRIGVPKEIKNNENRVAITPAGVRALTNQNHTVIIEKEAGMGSGFTDDAYQSAGAILADHPADVWNQADMVVKVKEPLPSEYKYFRSDLVLFTYLHLAAEEDLTKALLESGMMAIGYETVEENGTLPLLTPMSEIAGRMAAQIGAQFLEKTRGGRGILLGGIPGVKRGKVTIIGGGVVGTNAAKIATGLGADVTMIDINPARLRELDDLFGKQVQTTMSNSFNIEREVTNSDLVIGAVLIPGAKAPKLISEEMVKNMEEGSVIVDVAIDQGGIFETIDRTTTHDQPTFEKYGVVHYAVPNMPGAVPRTSTIGLTNVTLPYCLEIANKGAEKALLENQTLLKGLNVLDGKVTNQGVAEAFGYDYHDPENSLV
ncbi:MAG: alanine dehydrogenase [Bacillaceae bacterium]|nr:alanine dehydrogenase [Bacillaceae bacterium]